VCPFAPVAGSTVGIVARDQVILRSAALVRHAVGHYAVHRPPILDVEDIYGYGTIGLIDAVDRYDNSRGVKFETYAVTRIRGYLVDQLRAMDYLPRSARANVRLVHSAVAQIEEQLGRKPAKGELAEETGLDSAACDRALTDGAYRVVSLETVIAESDEGTLSLGRHLEDESSPNPANAAEEHELRHGIARPWRRCLIAKLRCCVSGTSTSGHTARLPRISGSPHRACPSSTPRVWPACGEPLWRILAT